MAYIAGVYLGDGNFYHERGHARIRFVMGDTDILQRVAMLVQELYGLTYRLSPIKGRTHLTRLVLTKTALARELYDMTHGKTQLPILDSDDAKRELIAGLMDTDGHIKTARTTSGQWQRFDMGFTNSGAWLQDFLAMLQSLGVKTGKPVLKRKYRSLREADCWLTGINIRSFIDAGCYFHCARKQAVLHAYLTHVRYQSY